jgi:hypothetical protein
MMRKNSKQKLDDEARADLKKELAKPRMARSAKIAELKRDITRTPEQPSTTMPGTVSKIIRSLRPSQPERAQISIDGADLGYRQIRIENALTDEHGDDVRLKKDGQVEVTVSSEPTPRTPSRDKE